MDPLRTLLRKYNGANGQGAREAIEQRMWEKFGTEACVFVLDMAGFSLVTQKRGIVHYMAMVETMRYTVEPMVTRHKGQVTKFEADNCFATFSEVADAVRAAVDVRGWFDSMNMVTADNRDIHLSTGIDFGRILLLEHDMWGEAVNLASKLGEDVAEAGEILVTKRAWERIPEDAGLRSETVSYSISGLKLDAHRVVS